VFFGGGSRREREREREDATHKSGGTSGRTALCVFVASEREQNKNLTATRKAATKAPRALTAISAAAPNAPSVVAIIARGGRG
jgi:hypothetical protein